MIDFVIPEMCKKCAEYQPELDSDSIVNGEIHHYCPFWDKDIDEVEMCRGKKEDFTPMYEEPKKIVCRKIVKEDEN